MKKPRKPAKPALTNLQLYRQEEQKIFDGNEAFMFTVNCPTNPLTREQLARLIARFPQRWERFSGFLNTLPSEKDLDNA